MVNIKNIVGACAIASGAVLGGCGNSVYDRAEQYLQDRPVAELKKVTENNDVTTIGHINAQSKLDSIAYRDVFTTTNAINDSSKVAEFNKIANKNRANDYMELDKLSSHHITVKEHKQILNAADKIDANSYMVTEYKQFKTDSAAYRTFFEKHKLLDEKTLKMFNKVSKQIRP